jgi:hypothetical protein
LREEGAIAKEELLAEERIEKRIAETIVSEKYVEAVVGAEPE